MTETNELLYEYTVKLTRVTEYGVSFAALMSGDAALPPEGARFDVWFEGEASGKLAGKVSGVDYLRIRSDGRFELDIHAEIETPDGHHIALQADGVCLPEPGNPKAELRENVTLFTSAEPYRWINHLQIWGVGHVDLAGQTVHIKGYQA